MDTADWRIPLTLLGKQQARAAGDTIRELLRQPVGDACSGATDTKDGRTAKIFFYVSPYRRTRQTLRGIMSRLDRTQIVGVREEPRISEQQFGNFQNVEAVQRAKSERGVFGRFFYRFPQGEAGFDVYSRVTSFISTVMRDCAQLRAEGHDLRDFNICIVTHGLTLRLFLMRWFQFTVDEFEQSFNPENGKVIVLERHTNPESGLQWYELKASALEHLRLPSYTAQKRFRMADDPSLLGVPREGEEEDEAFDWDVVDDINAEDNPNLDDRSDPRAREIERGNSII